ncbi:hypothetical protein ES703_121309 [subsurface metagenome]
MKLNLKDLQLKNCKGCQFANQEKVGTGQPCCSYPGMPRLEGNKCLTRKEAKHDSL